MWISEVFASIQGEGRYLGVPSSFLRTSGCNLRCTFCDTPYTSWHPEGSECTLDSLIKQVNEFACPHVVLTGGEPMLTPELIPLSAALKQAGYVVTVETAGTVYRPVQADLMSISPKLSNSTPRDTNWEARHDARRHRPDIIHQLTSEYDYQLKFVVAAPSDLDEVESFLDRHSHIEPGKVYLMPEGIERDAVTGRLEWLRPAAEQRGWQVTPRLHIELFGNTRGT